FFFFFSSRRRHTRSDRDWSSDVCSSDLHDLACCRTLPLGSPQAANAATGQIMTEGLCKPGYERVAEAFAGNFASKGEVGASVCRSEERRVGKEGRGRRGVHR